jgi:hypothetical protein
VFAAIYFLGVQELIVLGVVGVAVAGVVLAYLLATGALGKQKDHPED